jgi:hypothetical protein
MKGQGTTMERCCSASPFVPSSPLVVALSYLPFLPHYAMQSRIALIDNDDVRNSSLLL